MIGSAGAVRVMVATRPVDFRTRECLAIRVARKLNSADVIDTLSGLFVLRGVPGHVRSDNARSSSPGPCGSGSPQWGRRLPISPGKPMGERLL